MSGRKTLVKAFLDWLYSPSNSLATKKLLNSCNPQSHLLRFEQLEVRLPVSSAALGVVAGATLAYAESQSPPQISYSEETSVSLAVDLSLYNGKSSEESSLFDLPDFFSESEYSQLAIEGEAEFSGLRTSEQVGMEVDSILGEVLDQIRDFGNELHLKQMAVATLLHTSSGSVMPHSPTNHLPSGGGLSTENTTSGDVTGNTGGGVTAGMETSSVSYRGTVLTLEDDIAEVDGEGGGGVSMANLEFLDSLRESSAGQAGQNSGIQQTSSCGCGCGGGNDGCGCGCGSGSGSGLIMSARISQGEQTLEMNGCDAGTTNYKLSSCHIPNGFTFITENKIYALQGDNSTVFHAGFNYHQCGPGRVFIQGAEGVDLEDYWNQTVASVNSSVQAAFSWSLPAGVSNGDAARDFTFNYHVDLNNDGIVDPNEDCWSVDVHIGYAEVTVQFAGAGDFVHTTNTYGNQSADNTVIVGQKVHAKMEVDDIFAISDFQWSQPTGGGFVKDYVVVDEGEEGTPDYKEAVEGKVITHTNAEYEADEFVFYYTSNDHSYGYGTTRAEYKLTDPNGVVHSTGGYASYYIEAPTVTSFTSEWASWPGKADPPIGVRPFMKDEPLFLRLGGTVEAEDETDEDVFAAGITWIAEVEPSPYGGGEIAYCQLINREVKAYVDEEPRRKNGTDGKIMLDVSFPYNNQTDVGTPLIDEDSPGCQTITAFNKYTITDLFSNYLVYKPTGADSIWVSLAVMDWGWTGEATYDYIKWNSSGTISGGYSSLTTELPVWTDNIEYNKNWKRAYS